ncbi:MAG: hypothetical protein ABJM43_22840 [Paracoccaceae bacterium]
MRFLVNIILVLALISTSHSMAHARSAAAPLDQMVICVGQDLIVVYVDEDGQPVEAPQYCPECCLHAVPAPAMPRIARPASFFDAPRNFLNEQFFVDLSSSHDFLARAPPLGT